MIGTVLRNARYVFHKRGMMPVYLLLGATYRCNARCITCFNSDKLNRDLGAELTLDEHRKIASTMGDITWLLFTGGEPVLRDDLAAIANTYYKTNKVLRITVPTNGLLPEKTAAAAWGILDSCPQAHVAFSLAIDGVGELHDEIRGVRGNFEKLRETYSRLLEIRNKEKRFSLNLNTVLMDRNIDALDDLIRYVKEKMPGADFHGFEILRGSPPDKSLKPPSAEQYRAALEKLVPYWSGFPFYRGPMRRILKAAKVEARMMELDAMSGKMDMPCHAGWVSCVIDALGKVYFCEELADPIGSLRESGYDFRRVWFSEEARKLRNFVSNKGCRCTHSCFIGSSMMFEPRYYGKLFRRLISPF